MERPCDPVIHLELHVERTSPEKWYVLMGGMEHRRLGRGELVKLTTFSRGASLHRRWSDGVVHVPLDMRPGPLASSIGMDARLQRVRPGHCDVLIRAGRRGGAIGGIR